MTYEQLLERTPKSTSAGDRRDAEAFVTVISNFKSSKDYESLTDAQRRYLFRLSATWTKRAEGNDERWNEYGSRPGRPTKPPNGKAGKVKVKFKDDSDTYDDLSKRIIERYSKIRPGTGL